MMKIHPAGTICAVAVAALLTWPAYGAAAPGCPDDLDCDGVEDALDNCPDDANPLQEDLDFDDVGDVCDPIESNFFFLEKATVWATGNKLGRLVFKGRLFSGLFGPADLVDVTNGLTVRVEDGFNLDVLAEFSGSECVVRNSGLIRCVRRVDPQKKLRIVLRPKKIGGVATGEWKVVSRLQGYDIQRGFLVPLRVTITTEALDRQAEIFTCADGDTRLICRD